MSPKRYPTLLPRDVPANSQIHLCSLELDVPETLVSEHVSHFVLRFCLTVVKFEGLKAAFVHLKRVIVTPAVYQPLAPLDRSFRY